MTMLVGKPDISVIGEYTPPLVPHRPRRKRSPSVRWPSRVAGIAATVLLHMLITSSLMFGGGAQQKRQTVIDGTPTASWSSRGEQTESMILLDLSAIDSSDSDDSQAPSSAEELAISDDVSGLVLAASQPIPPREIQIEDDAGEDDESAEAAGDPKGQAQLFGKYTGQISARVERMWVRPNVPLDGGRFDCSARVGQDRQGKVLSVSLQDCSASEAWRHSLTSAILQASPLSAPPEPLPFAEILTLNFRVEQSEGAIPSDAANHVSQSSSGSLDQRAAAGALGDGEGDIELTIVGDKATWSTRSTTDARR